MIATIAPTQTHPAGELSLNELAAEINREYSECRGAYQSSLIHARNCGELLSQAKARLKHGDWQVWLQENCAVTKRTAQMYMAVARDWSRLAESETVSHLGFKEALQLLRADEPEERDIPILEAEIVEPLKPCSFGEGDRATVVNPSNLYAGKEVEVVGREGNWLIGRTGDTEYPFQASELQPSTPLQVVEPAPAPKAKPTAKQLVSLLERIYLEACGQLPVELVREIEAVIHG